MRSYKKKIPLFSPLKTATVAACTAIVSGLSILILGVTKFGIVFGAVSAVSFLMSLSALLGASGRYRYDNSCIELSYVPFIKKKLPYSRYNTIVISNASYNYDYCSYSMPMQYKVRNSARCTRITFPYITLLGPHYPLSKITPHMDNRNLYELDQNLYCLGICWFDSFEELLQHTCCDVYILEDVYITYKGKFDGIISQHKDCWTRFHIIRN